MVKKIIKKKIIFIIFILFILSISFIALFYIYQNNNYIYDNVLKFKENYVKKVDLLNYRNLTYYVENKELINSAEDKELTNSVEDKELTNSVEDGKLIKESTNYIKDEKLTQNAKNEELINSETPLKSSYNNVMCGLWQEQYTQFHRKMETSKKKKYLILDAHQCGWGDRLIQIVSGFYVALLSKRSFKIIGIDLENVFEKPNIDWTLDKEELKKLEKSKSIKELYYTSNDKNSYNEGFLYTNFTSNYEVSNKIYL